MTMTLIEGVGDEVTLFFVLALLAVVACLAWWTTRVTDRPLRIQTIIVGQRVIHVDERGEPTTTAATEGEREREGAGPEPPPGPSEPDCEEDGDGQVELVQEEEDGTQEEQSSGDGAASEGTGEAGTESESVSQETAPTENRDGGKETCTEPDSGTGPSDPLPDPASSRSPDPAPDPGPEPSTGPVSDQTSDQASDPESDSRQQLRRRRLAFMARQASESTTPATSASSGAADTQRTPADTSASAETERTGDTAERTTQAAEASLGSAETSSSSEGPQTITVKLKFLNDTQRLVEGSRAEPLADFKRRHFPTETAANRIVRLIFNGRVLPDQETLGQCGLYHNCVVHCHVSSAPGPAGGAAAAAGGGAPPELDIGVLLYPVLTSVVTLVWGLRLRYPELFSGTAVLLLAVLTVLLACFAAATFLPLERIHGVARAGAGERQQQRGR